MTSKSTHTLPASMRRDLGIVGPFVARPRAQNEALPRQDNIFNRTTYRTGDGDFGGVFRRGAYDHMRYGSRGNPT
jgi:hypothetical protein